MCEFYTTIWHENIDYNRNLLLILVRGIFHTKSLCLLKVSCDAEQAKKEKKKNPRIDYWSRTMWVCRRTFVGFLFFFCMARRKINFSVLFCTFPFSPIALWVCIGWDGFFFSLFTVLNCKNKTTYTLGTFFPAVFLLFLFTRQWMVFLKCSLWF